MQGTRNLFIAISGSARSRSTKTALLRSLASLESADYRLLVHDDLDELPIFNPDKEGDATARKVSEACDLIRSADGIVISSPEYVRGIPAGLKNAIDWLVSRDEIISMPIALVHASHRGDDMLASLRSLLSTVTDRFTSEVSLRIPLMAKSPAEIEALLSSAERRSELQ